MTDHYAVFGNPVVQSKSPMIHARFAAETGQDMDYVKIEAPVDGFADALRAFVDKGGRGCNVTAPFKLEAYALATEHTQAARMAGSTNTLRFDGNRIEAHNTDGVGLLRDIQDNLGHSLKGKRILMLGAGGAVRGAALPFLQAGPAEFALLNRSVDKAQAICDMLKDHGEIVLCDPVRAKGYDIVLNGTSSSLGGSCPTMPDGVFDGCALAYDLSYGKGLTPFLQAAQKAGVPQLADGVGMLVEQAAEAFAWWRGTTPATTDLIREMTIPLT
ncbi:shikimate dehydrogenase [Tropicibacter oceani]|uniref:Shikimate dehydrogenase (NADP(+)) n=1 Tax=Tropicibacter oceani TaxID=3058420 RepID=A0ABY8QI54_9RHOB|nr:shikimate dehydrogenase [Tropicibacter oceani]WGW04210.1 shikimate dehydrogenase [Tropicibacter oceani]